MSVTMSRTAAVAWIATAGRLLAPDRLWLAGERVFPLASPQRMFRGFSTLPPHTTLSMPSLSPTMSHGNLVKWLVKEGEEIAPGGLLADIETDKATLGWENQDEGFVARLLVPDGARELAVGTPLAILVESQDMVAQFANYGGPAKSSPASAEAAAASPAAATTPSTPAPPPMPLNSRLGPAAKKLLTEAGLSASDVTPSGPKGILTKGDVLDAIARGVKPQAAAAAHAAPTPPPAAKVAPAAAAAPAKPAAPAAAPAGKPGAGPAYTDLAVSQMRRIIAKRLLESKQTTPSLYASVDAGLDAVNALRKTMAEQGAKVSVNDFVIKAVALALRDVPAACVFWDSGSEGPIAAPSIDVAVAVATDKGLLTPVVKEADKKSLAQISKEVKDLASRARDNKLKPEEFMGGTFTISNLGMLGISHFSAIINPPQSGILAIGGAQQRVVLLDGKPSTRTVMTVTLSADNRIVDGEVAAAFLTAFSDYMSNPLRMVM